MNNSVIRALLETYVNERFNQVLKEKLNELKQHFPSHVVDRFSHPTTCSLIISNVKKRTKQNSQNRCHARTGKNKRCSRPIKSENSTMYCLSHCTTLPYGNIHQSYEFDGKKKRGRKKTKHVVAYSPEDSYLYVNSVQTDINGVTYYVDENRVIFDKNLNLVGYVDKDDCVKWF